MSENPANTFYFIENKDGSGFLLRGTTSAGKAIMVFRTREMAQAIIDKHRKGDEMEPVERNAEMAHQLLTSAKEQGTKTVIPYVTGSEDESSLNFMSIDTMLLTLELSR